MSVCRSPCLTLLHSFLQWDSRMQSLLKSHSFERTPIEISVEGVIVVDAAAFMFSNSSGLIQFGKLKLYCINTKTGSSRFFMLFLSPMSAFNYPYWAQNGPDSCFIKQKGDSQAYETQHRCLLEDNCPGFSNHNLVRTFSPLLTFIY